ncbi:MAG: hypothetical protein LBS74_01505 [Oscillospiraceae bacterium]|jgi:hypothetical protein|nr:hypothetical protein [Oscillospiraceae bacterium]
MNGNTVIDYRNPAVIRKLGIDALTKELGPVGMAYFIRQYDRGEGNYTKERETLLAGDTMEDVMREVNKRQNA